MHLYLTNRSPYARKIQILLAEKGLNCEYRVVDLANKSPEFLALGPIAKVPVLVDGTEVVFDSTVIAEYLEDRYPQPSMYGATWQDRLLSRQWEELADSLADATIQAFFSKDPAVIAKAEGIATRILAHANGHVDTIPDAFGVIQAALISALGYRSLRLGDGWREQAPVLAKSIDQWADRPSVRATVPRL